MRNKIVLNKSEYLNLINISLGYYKPLRQFCTFEDYREIIIKKKLNKKFWTIPILLNLKKKPVKKNFKEYSLFYEKKKIGYINNASIFQIDKKKFCRSVFKTNSKKHPGVKKIYRDINHYIGGKTFLNKSLLPKDNYFLFNKNKKEISKISKGVVFSTRNICHLGHQYIHEEVLKKNKYLTICIIESEKNKFDGKLLTDSYLLLKKKTNLYKNVYIVKILLPSLFAGPNEAYLQANLFKNNKFKKFIVGRDHAGYKNFYNKYASQKIFLKDKKLKLKIIKTKEPLMCSNCNMISSKKEKNCKCKTSNKDYLKLNGSDIKSKMLKSNFDEIKMFLNPLIFNFCKKNIKKIKKFKG